MASAYGATGPGIPGTNPSLINVIGSATIRASLYDIVVGCYATPADTSLLFVIKKTTAGGTGTGVTPEPLDSEDRPALCTCEVTHTGEPTFTGVNMITMPVNQRSTFRWVARPGGEFISPKAADDGLACVCTCVSGTPDSCYASFMWTE